MRQRLLGTWLVLGFALSPAQLLAQTAGPGPSYCTQVLQLIQGPQHRKLDSIKEITVGTFNVLDFGNQKDAKHIAQIAAIIKEKNPDILALQEVQGFDVLARFAKNELGDKYYALMTPIKDARGIQTGFLVKKDLPVTLELESHVSEMWVDPLDTSGAQSALFPRDLPTLFVRSVGNPDPNEKPLMIVIGTHLKSKRDRPGDPMSSMLRKAQADRAAEIVTRYHTKYGNNVPLLMVGDFNGRVFDEPEYGALAKVAQLQDAMAAEANPPPLADRTTHTFFPHNGSGPQQNQIDYALLAPGLKSDIVEGEVYRYKDPVTGLERPLPQNSAERDENPSDHFPYFVRMNFTNFLAKFRGRAPNSVMPVLPQPSKKKKSELLLHRVRPVKSLAPLQDSL